MGRQKHDQGHRKRYSEATRAAKSKANIRRGKRRAAAAARQQQPPQ